MGNRGHKRTDKVEELPADKRSCSSLEFRPSSSMSAVQTPTSSTIPTHDHAMETSSSASGSGRTDEDKDSAYGSCDSDEMGDADHRRYRDAMLDYQRQRLSSDQTKLKRVLTNLNEDTGESAQLAALSDLCEVLSFCTDSSLSSLMADCLSPALIKLARHESNPDIMLLSIRALTYLCDIHPRSSNFIARHDGVSALCQRLLVIEYVDVAEQCLQALEKISREQPLACLQSGAIMAVLTYIDFFSTSLQRVALSTVVNICEKLPSEDSSPFMDAVPILCKLLQYEDNQLVEHVSTCLIKIAERVRQTPHLLDELSKHGLIHQIAHLIDPNSRTTLCHPVQTGLIGLLVKLASGSMTAVTTLFDLNISSVLKDILSTFDLSHGMASPRTVDGHCNQAHEVLKLLIQLLPVEARNHEIHLGEEKAAFLLNHPDLLHKFENDLLPVLIQVVDSGVDLYLCYGCLFVIDKLVYYSDSDMLLELLKTSNISRFLAGVFARKDRHVLMLALSISDTILQKNSDAFLGPFIKEGVLFSIDALLVPEKCSQFMFSKFNDIQLSNSSTQKSSPKDLLRCLCYSFDVLSLTSESQKCKLEKDSVQTLAKHIRTSYFDTDSSTSETGMTVILEKLKSLSAKLAFTMNTVDANSVYSTQENEYDRILHQIMLILNGQDMISTFEFVESGIAKSLFDYLSNCDCSKGNSGCVRERRLEAFGRIFLDNFSLSAFISKLQNALSSVEDFPVVLNNAPKNRNSYATVPNWRCTMYPSLKVMFVRGEGELTLRDYSGDVQSVDPFSDLNAIEGFLWPKVCLNDSIDVNLVNEVLDEDDFHARSSSHVNRYGVGQTFAESTSQNENQADFVEQEQHATQDTGPPKLSFYLKEKAMDQALTIYQAILQQEHESEHDTITHASLWNQVYTVTYRKAPKSQRNNSPFSSHRSCASGQFTPLLKRVFVPDVGHALKRIPSHDILFLLRVLEAVNRYRFDLVSRERICAFSEGRINDLDGVKATHGDDLTNEFVNSRLTDKLDQQMRDPLAISTGAMPSWCMQLMMACPFLFNFEARCKYFRLAALGKHQGRSQASPQRVQGDFTPPRKKFLVYRHRILESAAKMMDLHANQKVVLEVEYDGEVGTGLGPTLEFFTLVSSEFQKNGLGMWRGDDTQVSSMESLENVDCATVVAPFGLFPHPWFPSMSMSSGIEFSEVKRKFVLLGQVLAKALHDGRVLDLPFSKAFYKLILGQELTVYDIESFDPELGKTLIEFQALVQRRKYLESPGEKSKVKLDTSFRNTKIEDLNLDFTLPGYPDYILASRSDKEMVTASNLEEYIESVVDATVKSGISRQMDAFRSGFNQVFPISHLQIFTEEELECLLCGEREIWNLNEISDLIKFDHGYTASSPPIIHFLEIVQELDYEQQKAFLKFVTGAPRLPPGGLASLKPKLTIVRKHCDKLVDADLPSVMTCANYLKLPPYSSKETMKEKLLYAIREGQGSFHLS